MSVSESRRKLMGETLGCESCKHFRGLTCTAFPRGIPSAIQGGQAGHLDPMPGDNGIQYEPSAEALAQVAELLGLETDK